MTLLKLRSSATFWPMKRSVLRNTVTAPTNSAPMPTIMRTLALGDTLYDGYATSVITAPIARRTTPVIRNSHFRARFWFF